MAGPAVTIALEIPRHTRLERDGKQERVNRELIRYNWPHIISITVSALLTLTMLPAAFSPV